MRNVNRNYKTGAWRNGRRYGLKHKLSLDPRNRSSERSQIQGNLTLATATAILSQADWKVQRLNGSYPNVKPRVKRESNSQSHLAVAKAARE
ncbi:MAG: hypothetical protein KME06_13460 [Kastovskya adunca ATA6-11-RM4]|nr:hypothetical protein [Kastovskya adunca ATA6-11-RM4]